MTWNSAKLYENRRCEYEDMKEDEKVFPSSCFWHLFVTGCIVEGGGGKLVHHLQDGFLFWWKIEILPLLLWTSVKVINLSMTSMKLLNNIRPKKDLVKHCMRSNIGSYTCCGCRQLKYTLMNYASTNTRNPSVQSTPTAINLCPWRSIPTISCMNLCGNRLREFDFNFWKGRGNCNL